MHPILTPAEMEDVDAANAHRIDALIEAAGGAVARAAVKQLGGCYGRRITVVAGPGNNGADGRVAAEVVRRRGARVEVFDARSLPAALPAADLVIDAAFGTGLSRPWEPPAPGGPVLAVDIPSGVSGLTGEALGSPWPAVATITFAAPKTGHLLGIAPDLTGPVTVADIDLDVGERERGLITDDDVAALVPSRSRVGHKWDAAVRIIAGSPGMTGAGYLCAAAAHRAGSGMVVASSRGVDSQWPTEAVARDLSAEGWAIEALVDIHRFGAVAIGPGLGTDADTHEQVREFLVSCPVPCVVDADGLAAIEPSVISRRSAPTIITPHEGEFSRLRGRSVAADRFADVVQAAADLGVIVLLKGPTTIVAAPDGRSRAIVAGDARLATAGTGDVLTGTIAALVARGVEPLDAAAVGAHVHGRAGGRLPTEGGIASDVVNELGPVLADLRFGIETDQGHAAGSSGTHRIRPLALHRPARRPTTWTV